MDSSQNDRAVLIKIKIMRKMTIDEIEDYVMLQEMTNLSKEEKETMSFADAKKLLGWS